MFSSPDFHVTRPLSNANDTSADIPTSPAPSQGRQFRPPVATPQIHAPITTTKLPVVIPATEKRQRILPPKQPPQRRRPIVLLGVLLGSIAIFVLAFLFVAPLDNGQHASSIAQTLNNWITSGHFGPINPSQHIAPPTPTPALLTNEGYCGGSDIWGICATAVTASGVMGTGQMRRPLQSAVITQAFGHPEYQWWCGCWRPHTGIDLAAAYGSPIMVADSGQVIWTGWDWSGLGWAVKINHGHYIATIYGHMDHFIVKIGQNVTRGQVIGYEGSTGASTGPHLHFMVLVNNIWVNPTLYVQLP